MKLDKKTVDKILELRRSGYLIDHIAERFGLARSTVLKALAKVKGTRPNAELTEDQSGNV